MMEVPARQTVLFVLRHLSGRGEQFELTPDVPSIRENRKKGIGGHQSTVHICGEDVDVVVFVVKRGFSVRLIESVVVNAAQQKTFDRVPMNKCATCPLQDGVHFAVDGRQRVIGRTLGECIDVSHLDSWSQGSFSHEHVGVHGVNYMVGSCARGL